MFSARVVKRNCCEYLPLPTDKIVMSTCTTRNGCPRIVAFSCVAVTGRFIQEDELFGDILCCYFDLVFRSPILVLFQRRTRNQLGGEYNLDMR